MNSVRHYVATNMYLNDWNDYVTSIFLNIYLLPNDKFAEIGKILVYKYAKHVYVFY